RRPAERMSHSPGKSERALDDSNPRRKDEDRREDERLPAKPRVRAAKPERKKGMERTAQRRLAESPTGPRRGRRALAPRRRRRAPVPAPPARRRGDTAKPDARRLRPVPS